MKVAVITATLGGMDQLRPFPDQDFTGAYDRFIVTNSHQIEGSARERARYIKIQSHTMFTGYDAFIWVDGNVQIKAAGFISEMMAALKDSDIAIAKHPSRSCIYDEAEFILAEIAAGKKYLAARYDRTQIIDQANVYARSVPAGAGLYWCGLFARRATVAANEFFNQWWEECQRWPQSIDQIPFPYLVQKTGIKLREMTWGNFNDNPTYSRMDHLKMQ